MLRVGVLLIFVGLQGLFPVASPLFIKNCVALRSPGKCPPGYAVTRELYPRCCPSTLASSSQQQRQDARRPPIPRGTSGFSRMLHRVGERWDRFLNTSFTYAQRGGYSWTFRPFKVFSIRDDVLEKSRTNLRLRGGDQRPRTRSPEDSSTNLVFPEEEAEDVRRPIKFVDEASSGRNRVASSSTPPYIVTILRDEVPLCSGVVLDSKHILTAASCFVSDRFGPRDSLLHADSTALLVQTYQGDGASRNVRVEHLCLHKSIAHRSPDDSQSYVAVLTLGVPLVFTEHFHPARIVWESYDNAIQVSGSLKTTRVRRVLNENDCRRPSPVGAKGTYTCAELAGPASRSCLKPELLGGGVECSSPGGRRVLQTCGIVTKLSACNSESAVVDFSAIPRWIYPILTNNDYDVCF